MLPPSVPYSLAIPRFRFRALAALAGRAPLGGAREVALATYLAARLVDDAHAARTLSEDTRSARAAAARTWLSALAVPGAIRPALGRLLDATTADANSMHAALRSVIEVTAEFLDTGATSELEKLAQGLLE